MVTITARRRILGLTFLVVGLALLGWGASAAYGLVDHAEPRASPADSATAPASSSRTVSDVTVRVETLGRDIPLTARTPDVAPVRTELGTHELDTGTLPIPARVELDVTQHTLDGPSTAPHSEGTSVASVRQTLVLPPAEAVAIGAAAMMGAGLLAYFWGAVKAWGARVAIAPAIGLYAKISRAEVFDNAVRERVFQAIRATPGISASDLAKLVGVSWGTTIYHLEVLEQNHMVTSLRKGRHRRYFENGADLATSKDVVALLSNPVTATVARTIASAPGATQKDLASATGMSPQALHWHLVRLTSAGLVRKERAGRFVKHYANA